MASPLQAKLLQDEHADGTGHAVVDAVVFTTDVGVIRCIADMRSRGACVGLVIHENPPEERHFDFTISFKYLLNAAESTKTSTPCGTPRASDKVRQDASLGEGEGVNSPAGTIDSFPRVSRRGSEEEAQSEREQNLASRPDESMLSCSSSPWSPAERREKREGIKSSMNAVLGSKWHQSMLIQHNAAHGMSGHA
ncbi:hypothetical protein GUITHDRAFT_105779 [Guillardia theta CCMP2712]|uniref:Uncharacterized protein n=1 Tax=Guillardia theta (strain CCMP2712) TaxID=905079 RepID=L1JKG3_GUITC|nr:hypothetical protein GUITHDRAFT_105779 [Guillardia theta CCMP2712]EKX48634.1 hypothetical protein GUITHDRAFT_105779 [Guillardia theta CCMP2712]|eukprot:XP_005835614.1 hypothetical protein GUITHDRAFT_105779 [Guillardia theta CCMP2712]